MNTKISNLDMAGHLIRRLHQHSTQIFLQQTLAAGFDITSVQYAALEAIFAHPRSDQANIAQLIGYDRATIGGVIERLEKKDWITRVVSSADRRARELSLTPRGNKIRLKIQPLVQELQKVILSPLSPGEQANFLQLTRKIIWPRDESRS